VAPKDQVWGNKALPWCVCHHPHAQTLKVYAEDRIGDSNTVTVAAGWLEAGRAVAGLELFLSICVSLCAWVKAQLQLYFGNTGIWIFTVGEAERKCRWMSLPQMTIDRYCILHPILCHLLCSHSEPTLTWFGNQTWKILAWVLLDMYL